MGVEGRDLHGLANLHGSWVQIAAGMGAGWKFPTRQKPLPAGQVARVSMGFFFPDSSTTAANSRLQSTPLLPPTF